jgi:hypothetical protein
MLPESRWKEAEALALRGGVSFDREGSFSTVWIRRERRRHGAVRIAAAFRR